MVGAEDLVAGVVLADGGQEAPDSAALTGGLDLEARRPEGIIGLITVMGQVVWVVVPSC